MGQTELVIPFTPAARSAGAEGVDQVDKAGQTIFSDCFTKQLASPKQIVSMLSTWLRRFLISFEQNVSSQSCGAGASAAIQ